MPGRPVRDMSRIATEEAREIAELREQLRELRARRREDQRLAAQHLEELYALADGQRRLLAAALGQLQQGVLLVAGDGRVRLANPAARRLLGHARARSGDLATIGKAAGLPLERLLEEEPGQARLQRELQLPGDRSLLVERIALGPAGMAGQFLLVLEDISSRLRRQRAQGDFVSTVSHELRTPLTSMSTALEIVLGGEAGELAEEQEHFLAMAQRNVGRLGRLIQQLLDLGRQEAGALSLDPTPRDLAALLRELLEPFASRARREGRELRVVLPGRLEAPVDADRFAQVVDNLVGNAFKFTGDGGRIAVRLRPGHPCPDPARQRLLAAVGLPAEGCLLEVDDDGPGISAPARERAFERFYQEGDPLSDRPSGAGLGLAISRALVEAHGGHIALESEEGRGTRALAWLPSDPAAGRLLAALPRSTAWLEGVARRLGNAGVYALSAEPGALGKLGEWLHGAPGVGHLWIELAPGQALWLCEREDEERALPALLEEFGGGRPPLPAPMAVGAAHAPREGRRAEALLALALERRSRAERRPSRRPDLRPGGRR